MVTVGLGALAHAGRSAIDQRNAAAARRIAEALCASPATAAEGHFIAGLADALEGRLTAGIAHLDRAVALAPSAEYQAQRARLLITSRREAEARDAVTAAEALGPRDALTFDTIGCVHTRLGDHHAAAAMFEPAVARDPANPSFRYNLASALGFIGATEAAAEQYEHVLARQPLNGRVHYALALGGRATPAANHIARLEACLADRPGSDDAIRIRYALAKEYEDIGDPAATFRHLAVANAAQKAAIGHDFARDAAIFDALEAGFADPGYFSGFSAVADAPIFVTGMPRTGTTLVDRILASHAAVHSVGELQAIPLAVKELAGTRSRLIIDPETIAAARHVDPAAIGARYMDRANQHRRRPDGRFIDKLPANFLYIGHIARALPNASIICLRRNPMDTVWSNYKNLFAVNSAYYFYSYDLIDTARYYARFDRLMAFWNRLLPGRILQVQYALLVADQEAQSRRLFAHCGLEWTPAALDFHTQSAAVATPSAAQVRRPMNRDAVDRWRDHEAALAPVRAFFEGEGIAV